MSSAQVRVTAEDKMEILKNILALFGGASIVLSGLVAYLGKIRLEAFKSQLQQTESKLKGLLDRAVHVTKTQFDKEFTIYQQIWASLVPLRAATLSLRPMLDHVDPNESEEDRMRRRLTEFSGGFATFRDLVEQHKPFYAPEVYASLAVIMQLCHEEAIDYQYKSDDRREYWEGQKKSRDAIIHAIDSCCELIRGRIEKLAVLE